MRKKKFLYLFFDINSGELERKVKQGCFREFEVCCYVCFGLIFQSWELLEKRVSIDVLFYQCEM